MISPKAVSLRTVEFNSFPIGSVKEASSGPHPFERRSVKVPGMLDKMLVSSHIVATLVPGRFDHLPFNHKML